MFLLHRKFLLVVLLTLSLLRQEKCSEKSSLEGFFGSIALSAAMFAKLYLPNSLLSKRSSIYCPRYVEHGR